MSYRQFCRRYTNWVDNAKVTFHIQRYPGVNLELDFAGKTLSIHDRHNPAKTTTVTIFVAALSFSDFFYIEGMTCCDVGNWIRVNNNALSYFGGITQTVTPDNCKVAVTENKDWINPSVNKDFQAWAEHNGTVIMPAKVKSPRWKPVVEGHVRIITMHILVEMAEMTFYSLEELNTVLWEKMERENRENFQGLRYSRRDLFENEEVDYCDLLDELLVLSRRVNLERYRKRLKYYARIQILFIDDFAISRYLEEGIKILYHLVKTRTDLKISTMFTCQYATSEWGKQLSDEEGRYGKLDGIRRRLTTGYTVHIEKL